PIPATDTGTGYYNVADKIISISLAEEPHEDFQAWSAEASGEYTVRSAYKLLQDIEDDPRAYALQADYKDFYKKLWLLDLLSKIKIIVWKISWNFLTTRVNMLFRRLTNTTVCPRCGSGTENMDYLFCECPVSSSTSQCKIFYCALWAIWGDRNDRVHKKREPQIPIIVSKWRKPSNRVVKINFDAAYDGRHNKSAVGIVARDSEGTVLLSCSEIHQRVTSAFVAEALACQKALQIGIDMHWEK
ncbi:hypothetical protein Gohar_028283, partial [Gossypium harknessii]|nr:hypothetical protein [Gossypium harknessii]